MNNLNFQYLLILLLLFFVSNIYSQNPGVKGLVTGTQTEEVKRGKTYALVFGVSEYEEIRDLRFADKDATAFANYLQQIIPADSLVLFQYLNESATRGKFFSSLFQISEEADSLDRVFIFFSGHGDAENNIDPNAYLLPNNAPYNSYAYSDLSDPTIPI